MRDWLPAVVMFPLVSAALTPFLALSRAHVARAWALLVVALTSVGAVFLTSRLVIEGPFSYAMGDWSRAYGIELRFDGFSSLRLFWWKRLLAERLCSLFWIKCHCRHERDRLKSLRARGSFNATATRFFRLERDNQGGFYPTLSTMNRNVNGSTCRFECPIAELDALSRQSRLYRSKKSRGGGAIFTRFKTDQDPRSRHIFPRHGRSP